jgi:hypothetical protein
MRKVWIEAALNGPWGRERQPGMLPGRGPRACFSGSCSGTRG